MNDWNPALYSRYEEQRTRPARELLARVPLAQAKVVVDLGCGPGNSTQLLVHRFPGAKITGIDTSAAMLATAIERVPQARFEFGDIASWLPALDEAAPQVIYANAALHWVPDHAQLIPRLFAALPAKGVLAVQMPDNRDEPSHRLMRDLAAEAPWSGATESCPNFRADVLSMASYYDLMAGDAVTVDIWRTVYQQVVASAAAIVEWVRATGLKPFVDRLPPDLQKSYLAEYTRRVDSAYPVRSDGQRLLAFPRLFIVAQKKA